ncbi:MAG TPA: phosphoglycerate kinase [Thermoanaerobaculia bacterium]|jgi:phosphoglycerate kinase|nr:phosphoglycerate kinase [Thermoanaerobaculia bacterium]
MIRIRTLDQLSFPAGARVFYRVDYNVPLVETSGGTRITDATRIEETLPTLRALRERGAAIILASHLGRPKGTRNEKYSLQPIREKLAELLGIDVQWADDCVGIDTSQLKAGELLLLENLRFHAGEEKNDPAFAAQLREEADYYVNDAFGACHRAHASIDALPRLLPKENTAGGLLLAKELQFLQKVTNIEERPFVALMGGAKIAGKIEPLEALVKLADKVLIGGGMANTFLAARGVPMGGSLVDTDSLEVAGRIMESNSLAELVLPIDMIIADSLDNPTEIEHVEVSEGLTPEAKAFDIGPKTIKRFEAELKEAKLIFWNGPMGVFEKEQFARGTMAMAGAVAAADAITVVGGGESVEAIKASGFADRITHISTGGGASLEFIAGAELPGVEVLRS